MFNARQLFRPFGYSSVASKSSFFPFLSSFVEQILVQTRDICVDLGRKFPALQLGKKRDRLHDFKALQPPPFHLNWDLQL